MVRKRIAWGRRFFPFNLSILRIWSHFGRDVHRDLGGHGGYGT